MKERMNYTKTPEGKYFGYLVSLPQIYSTADSLEELEERLKVIAFRWLEYYSYSLNSGLDKMEFESLSAKDWSIKMDLLIDMSRKTDIRLDHLKHLD